MNKINLTRMMLAFGITGALLDILCIIFMISLGKNSMYFFNDLFHSMAGSSILKTRWTLWEAVSSVVETFVIFWLAGACIAFIYNKLHGKKQEAIY